MRISSRAVAWSLGMFTVVLLIAAVLAMTGAFGLDETVVGTYTGVHIIGLVVAVTGVLAIVAASLRGITRT